MTREFRLFATQGVSNQLFHNLAVRLGAIQREFPFAIHKERVALPSQDQPLPAEDLVSIAQQVARQRYDDQFPILITSAEIDDGGLASYDASAAVISVSHWRALDFSPWPEERFVLATLADVLLGLYVETPVHHPSRGCINDRCEDVGDVNEVVSRCEYCGECRRLISSALNSGAISPRQLAAINRILDSAAERRRAFVLMPFARRFNATYETIREGATASGWSCSRADDVFHTRDTLSVIMEEIERSDLVLADLTGRSANVFYELGYAHAAGRNTVLLTRERLDTLPFDLRQRPVVKYMPTERGRDRLLKSLEHYFAA